MRILVIEDNHRLNSSLVASLTHEGYSVDSAYDGQEGQDFAEMTVPASQKNTCPGCLSASIA